MKHDNPRNAFNVKLCTVHVIPIEGSAIISGDIKLELYLSDGVNLNKFH